MIDMLQLKAAEIMTTASSWMTETETSTYSCLPIKAAALDERLSTLLKELEDKLLEFPNGKEVCKHS
jgi:hypothetical protein